VEAKNKPTLLVHFIQNIAASRTLVFTRTKHGADKVVRRLMRDGINATAIHGNKSQNARQSALAQFKSSRPPVLVATDIAARGLDIDAISHIINYDMPDGPETYVHRIGRTGRAGATGAAFTFCAQDERSRLRLIERTIRCTITVEHKHPDYPKEAEQPSDSHARKQSHGSGGGSSRPQAAASGGGRPSYGGGSYGERRGARSGGPGGAGKARPRTKERALTTSHSNHSGHASHGSTAVASAGADGGASGGAAGRSRRPGKRRWRRSGTSTQGQAN
ncbi:MAG: C-terminal helicase domain-containing protein, partial [Planctomycetia bacterium]|nr:C-terminal helicase domain-containing protein [Planctomycetia bacterium]